MKKKRKFPGKTAVFLLMLTAFLLSAVIRPQEASAAGNPENGIVFERKSVKLYAGEYTVIRQVSAFQDGRQIAWKDNLLPHESLKYSSDNKKVATVNRKGVVTAKGKGTAEITVASVYAPEVKGTFTVKVTKGRQNAKITLKKTKATLETGKGMTVTVKSVKGLSTKTLKYASDNKKVATVSPEGKVTAKGAGTAKITVTSPVNKKVKAVLKLTVRTRDLLDTAHSPEGKAAIVLEKTEATLWQRSDFDSVWDGQLYETESAMEYSYFEEDFNRFEPDVKKQVENAYEKYGYAQIRIRKITGLKSTAVTYKSGNTGVAEVSASGLVQPRKAGTATITVTSKENRKVSASFRVTVQACDTILAVEALYPVNLKYYVRGPEWVDPESTAMIFPGGIQYRAFTMETIALAPRKSVAHLYTYLTGCKCGKNLRFVCSSSNENVIKIVGEADSSITLYTTGKGEATLTIRTQDGKFSYSWKCRVSDEKTRYSDGFVDKSIDDCCPAERGWVTDESML